VQSVCSVEAFGAVRQLARFRLHGTEKDLLACGSDSGRVSVLEYDADRAQFVKLHQETFGKSGCRRIVPGQMVATDPKGRACMLGALEKQKMVYVFNRDSSARVTISSPLEAHKSNTLCFDLCAVDNGFDNPIFAAIELDHAEVDADPTGAAARAAQKQLVYYELDLGLNHVTRQWADPVDNGANMVLAVPGGGDGPSGVIVCAENFVIYKHKGHADVRAVIPRREDLPPERGCLIVAGALHRQKGLFFFILQSEYGDLYKVSLVYDANDTVSEMRILYFDTIPTCISLCVFKNGHLFAASEFGNHAFYSFAGIGDEDNDVMSSSAQLTETDGGFEPVFFRPRPLKNLALLDEMESLCPVTAMKVENLHNEDTKQVYALCGRGHRSSLRVLRPGLSVAELARSPLPGTPTGVWTVRKSVDEAEDKYIVVSFTNGTLVLAVGDTVGEVSNSGLNNGVQTLLVQLLSDGSMLQVHAGGLRHVRTDGRLSEWAAPGRKRVSKVAANAAQVVVAMSGGELVYFELDTLGTLAEVERRDLAGDVAALDMPPLAEGSKRAAFLAVGAYDSTVRLFSLDPNQMFAPVATQAVPALPESVCLFPFQASANAPPTLFLNVGLANGVLLRAEVDPNSGDLSDPRTRFLGTRAPQLSRVVVRGRPALMALSARPWCGYSWQGRFQLAPLSYDALDAIAPFASGQCAEGIVATAGDELRILTLERLGEAFNSTTTPLPYTPRAMCHHPKHKTLVVVAADYRAPTAERRTQLRKEAVGGGGAEAAPMDTDGADGGADGGAAELLADDQLGEPRVEAGKWASCVRVLTSDGEETYTAALDEGEAALCACVVKFAGREEGTLLAVGTTTGLQWSPRRCAGGHVRLYRFTDEGKQLELLHKTEVGGVVGAVCAFQGKLLVGVDSSLRLYDMGKKKLLRKCENRAIPSFVKTLHVQGERVYVGDAQESFHYVLYRAAENQLHVFADDLTPRYVTAAEYLDYDTLAGGDKFGNLFVLRLPAEMSGSVDEDPTGGSGAPGEGKLNGAPNKLECATMFHVGDVVTAVQRAELQPGGTQSLLYATVGGSLMAATPFERREEVDFFSHLEMHMRTAASPLLGNDHLQFRSKFAPVKDVIDGDLCEMYASLGPEKQRAIAEQLEATVGEVLKRLEARRELIV
jgi:splicing factor 3B subunit 3